MCVASISVRNRVADDYIHVVDHYVAITTASNSIGGGACRAETVTSSATNFSDGIYISAVTVSRLISQLLLLLLLLLTHRY